MSELERAALREKIISVLAIDRSMNSQTAPIQASNSFPFKSGSCGTRARSGQNASLRFIEIGCHERSNALLRITIPLNDCTVDA